MRCSAGLVALACATVLDLACSRAATPSDAFHQKEQVFNTLGVRAKEHFLSKMSPEVRENFLGRLSIQERESGIHQLRGYEDGENNPLWKELVREEKDWRSQKTHPTPAPTVPPTPHPTPPASWYRRRRAIVTMPPTKAYSVGLPGDNLHCKPPQVKRWEMRNGEEILVCDNPAKPTPVPTPYSCPKPGRRPPCSATTVGVLVKSSRMFPDGSMPQRPCKTWKCVPTPCVPLDKQKKPPCIPFPRHAALTWKQTPIPAYAHQTARCQVWHCVWPRKKKKVATHSLLQFTKHTGHAVGPIWPARCSKPAGVKRAYEKRRRLRVAASVLGLHRERKLLPQVRRLAQDDDGAHEGDDDTLVVAVTKAPQANEPLVQEADATTAEQCATLCLKAHECNSFNWYARHHFTKDDYKTIDKCELCTERDYTTQHDGQGVDAYTRKRQVHEFVGDDDAAVDDDQRDGGRREATSSRRRRGATMGDIMRSAEERSEERMRLRCAKHAVAKGPCYAEPSLGNNLKKISMRTTCMNDDDDDSDGMCAGLCCRHCNQHDLDSRDFSCTHWQLDQYGYCVLYSKNDNGLAKPLHAHGQQQCYHGVRVPDPALQFLAAHPPPKALVHVGASEEHSEGAPTWNPGKGEGEQQANIDTSWMDNERGDCDGHPCGVKCPEQLHGSCKLEDWQGCVQCARDHGFEDSELCSRPHIEFVCQNLATAMVADKQRTSKGLRPYAEPDLRPFEGFRSSFGEMGACILDKAELLLSIIYQMATCTRYEQWHGSGCYEKQADVFVQQLRLCCAGNQKLANQISVTACNKAVLPFAATFLKGLKPTFDRCVKEPAHDSCVFLNHGIKACYKLMDAWRVHRPRQFRSEEERSQHFEHWASEHYNDHEADEIKCRGLFLGAAQPGNSGPKVVVMFRALVHAATSLYALDGWSDKDGSKFGKANPEVRDVTGRAMSLMRLCASTQTTTTTSAPDTDDHVEEHDGRASQDAMCALRLATRIAPLDIDRGNAWEEESGNINV